MADLTHLTSQEISESIKAFLPAQKALLIKKSKIFALGLDISGNELLHEAFTLALMEQRKCPRTVKVTTFLINVMRSIASHARESIVCNPSVLVACSDIDETVSAGEEWNAETTVSAARVLEKITKKFAGDDVVMKVLEARYEGWNKSDTCEILGITVQEYEAAAKRLRRFAESEIERDQS